MSKKSWASILSAILILVGLTAWEKLMLPLSSQSSSEVPPSAVIAPTNTPIAKTDTHTIQLTLLGDVMCHPAQYEAAKTEEDYDFRPSFEDIAYDTANADLTLANLETTFAGQEATYSGYPSFNTPEEMIDALKDTLGVDVVSTANNHALDRNYSGLCRTIDFLDSYGLKHTGTYKTKEDSGKILIEDVSGLNIAFLSYTYATNGVTLPKGKDYAINYLNRDKIQQDAQKAREAGADLIIASLHWGTEYAADPSTEQKALARWVFENTEVDIISGNHVHTVQPIDFINVVNKLTGKEKEGLVIYAQGNFISDQKTDTANMGIVVNIFLDTRPGEKPTITHLEYYPTWVDESAGAGLRTFRVLHVEKALEAYRSGKDSLLSDADYNEMLAYTSKIEKIIPSSDRIRDMQ